jgi:hypothetical protein
LDRLITRALLVTMVALMALAALPAFAQTEWGVTRIPGPPAALTVALPIWAFRQPDVEKEGGYLFAASGEDEANHHYLLYVWGGVLGTAAERDAASQKLASCGNPDAAVIAGAGPVDQKVMEDRWVTFAGSPAHLCTLVSTDPKSDSDRHGQVNSVLIVIHRHALYAAATVAFSKNASEAMRSWKAGGANISERFRTGLKLPPD